MWILRYHIKKPINEKFLYGSYKPNLFSTGLSVLLLSKTEKRSQLKFRSSNRWFCFTPDCLYNINSEIISFSRIWVERAKPPTWFDSP